MERGSKQGWSWVRLVGNILVSAVLMGGLIVLVSHFNTPNPNMILITALVCYFLGNHNGAVCVSAMLHDDVRQHGSGNAGLTNFIRNFGAGRSALVIAIDAVNCSDD